MAIAVISLMIAGVTLLVTAIGLRQQNTQVKRDLNGTLVLLPERSSNKQDGTGATRKL